MTDVTKLGPTRDEDRYDNPGSNDGLPGSDSADGGGHDEPGPYDGIDCGVSLSCTGGQSGSSQSGSPYDDEEMYPGDPN